jgi:2-iminobutanoate/2-iminopropanoate deaminase
MSQIFKIETPEAPQAIGPYSQAIATDQLIFCSGQIGIDPKTGDLVEGGIAAQTTRAISNLSAVLAAAESNLDHVVKTEIFLKDMNDFKEVNEIYATFFSSETKPARATVEVSRLPKDAIVEISCIAVKK